MVTHADGTTSVETLAQAGITSIDLEANSVTRNYADGSSIDDETTFTRADGSTGTATSVTFKQVAAGSVLETPLITQNPDGSTTVDNVTVHPDGSLATETISTTSADGLTKTLAFDDAGNGIIDRRQTDDTVVGADGSKTETVSDTNGSGVLEDSTTTTTSADVSSVHDRPRPRRQRHHRPVRDPPDRRRRQHHRHPDGPRGQRRHHRPDRHEILSRRPVQDHPGRPRRPTAVSTARRAT